MAGNSFLLDGEIVSLDEEGRPRFQLLQPRINQADKTAVERLAAELPAYYFAFDLISCEGYDLRGVTLAERKKLLQALLSGSGVVRYTEGVRDKGQDFFKLACREGLEGIIAKDLTSTYGSRRSRQWLKVKCTQQQEFVIAGYTPATRSRSFGALVLGLFRKGELVCVGKVGSGFDESAMQAVHAELQKRKLSQNPFKVVPKGVKVGSWVTPDLVCQVKFNEWTQGGYLRAPVFMGLRPDLDAGQCEFEAETEADETPELSFDFLSNLDKVFWPGEEYTKRDLVAFYDRIADVLVPHLKDRPMVLERFPGGIGGDSFYQKNAPDFLPDWIPRVAVTSDSAARSIDYILCNDRRTLVYLANMACVSQHPWSSRIDHLDNPDFLIIDLDPSEGVPYSVVCKVANRVRHVLESLELRSYPKTSGATGIHILVPLQRRYGYDDVRNFAEILARLTVSGLEEVATIQRSIQERKNKVYVDYLQNGRGKTIASAYSLRPRPGAPVSTPLEWSEIGSKLRPESFNIRTIFSRLDRKGDLFEKVRTDRQSLRKALRTLEKNWKSGL